MNLVEERDDGLLSLPGLIDCHVHFREPGLMQNGDMRSESEAARAGGVLAVCEMPNTVPPTVTQEAFQEKVELSRGIRDCDIHFFFGITERAHLQELRNMASEPWLRQRCSGVKLYLDHSTGDQKIDGAIIDDVFKICKELDFTLVAHCEDAAMNEDARRKTQDVSVSAHSLMRPPESEAASIRFAIEKAKKFGTRFHVAHLSTKEGLDLVRQAKRDRLSVTCEVAPHHLFLTTDDYETLGTLAKMNPPLRTEDHQEALWEGLVDGTVDCIATDHAPHTLEEKRVVDPLAAPSGVPGVETMLPLLLSVASDHWPHPGRKKKPPVELTYEDIAYLCFEGPNRIFRLGKDAGEERILVDPEAEWTIYGKDLHSKCGWTPFEGWKVRGKVV